MVRITEGAERRSRLIKSPSCASGLHEVDAILLGQANQALGKL